MPFEYFLLLLSIVGAAAGIATPFILRYSDRKVNERLNNIGRKR
jgi:hypothetical protein